jgi:hypothetical protein
MLHVILLVFVFCFVLERTFPRWTLPTDKELSLTRMLRFEDIHQKGGDK